MRRSALWSIVALVAGAAPSAAWAQQDAPPPVEEWQIRGILAGLKDGHVGVRNNAAKKLAEFLGAGEEDRGTNRQWKGNSRKFAMGASDDLRKLLSDKSVDFDIDEKINRTAHAAGVLGRLGAQEAVPELLSLLQDRDTTVRVFAAEALARLGDRRAVPALLDALKDYGAAGLSAAVTLAWLREKEAVPELRKLLKDDSHTVRARAAGVLGWLGDKQARPELLKFLKEYDDEDRTFVAEALVRLGDNEATPELLKLINDPIRAVRATAAQVLGRLGDKGTVPELLVILKRPDDAALDAADALGRLGDKGAVPELRRLVNDPNQIVREAAVRALGQLGDNSVVPQLSGLLKDENVRARAAEALGQLGDKRAGPKLIRLLEDPHPIFRETIAKALGRLGDKGAVPELCRLLSEKEPFVCASAAEALGRLGDKSAVPDLVRLLKDRHSFVRANVVEALERLGDRSAVPELIGLLTDADAPVRGRTAEALGRLRKSELPELVTQLLNKIPTKDLVRLGVMRDVLRLQIRMLGEGITRIPAESQAISLLKELVPNRVVSVLEHLEPMSIIAFLRVPYEHTPATADARWLAHYWCEVTGEPRLLLAYLGRPASQPELPNTREAALPALAAFSTAWDETETWKEDERRSLREDLASWVSLIITENAKDWTADDLAMLRNYKQRFENEKASRVRAYAGAIQRIIDPFEIPPPPWWRIPWVQAILAFVVINLVVLLTIALRPGLGGLQSWLPFLVYAGAGAGSWLAAVVAKLDLDPWLLGGLLVGEFVFLIAAGVVSPATLRHVARIEPLNRVAVPLALRLPWSRRRIFREHVATVKSQLERDKRQANRESYFTLPADMLSQANQNITTQLAPAAEIVKSLTGPAAQRGHVLIEAPGGRGKSALLREVVRLALEQFERSPGSTPVPVLLSGGDESIEKMLEKTLAGVLVSPAALAMHLEACDFFLVLDGISESGLSVKVVSNFLQGPYAGSAPLLVSSRPTKEYRSVIEGAARWTVAEPRRLDESLLREFVRHYGGKELPASVQTACRLRDGTYLPILVRMAMSLQSADDVRVSVADIYRSYFLRLFEAKLADEGARLKWLGETAQWCLKTYWRDGLRTRSYEADDLQKGLVQAGVLIPADDLEPPAEVHFCHDSMQSYMTAHGLALQDREGYQQLPRPVDDSTEGPWDRNRVLLWAAANEKFARAQADLLQTGGAELFQMCLTTFTPREGLRQWLCNELKSWASDHDENLRRKDIMAAIPPQVVDQVKGVRGAARLFAAAVDASFETDAQEDSVDLLGRLYAGIAPFVYEIGQTKEAGTAE